MLFKNVASQGIHVYAYNSTTGAPKTGDAGNITAYVSLDGTADVLADTNPAEVDSTNMPGVYYFTLEQAETNCNSFALYAKSATENIRIEPIIGFTTGAVNTLSVNTGTITANAITAAAINDGAIDAATFAAGAINAAAIAADAIELAKIKDGAISAAKFAANAITSTVVADNTITANKINADAITATKIAAGAIDIATFAADCLTGGFLKANVESITAGAITATAIATGAIDADSLAADAGTEIGTAVWATAARTLTAATNITSTGGTTVPQTGDSYAIVNGDHGLVSIQDDVDAILADTNELELDWKDGGRLDLLLDGASAAGDPWLTLIPGAYTAGMAGYILGTNINATISSRGTGTALDAAGVRTAVGLATANLDTQLTAISGYVDCLPATWVVPGTGTSTLTSGDIATALTTALTTTTMAEDYPADGAAATPAELLYLILSCVSQFDITTTTLTTRKLDGTTQAAAYTLDSATAPTSRVRSA